MTGNEMYERVFGVADGTIADTEAALAGVDVDQMAMLVLTEVASRTQFFEGPPEVIAVQFDLGHSGDRWGYRLMVGGGAVEVVPGWDDSADVRVRQDLAELVRAVYGTPGIRHDATREVWINDAGRPMEFSTEDPWVVRCRLASSAAGQVIRACDQFRPTITDLALRFGSDKWGGHWYTPHYELHFAPYRQQRVKVLEIGVGGYRSRDTGGASLRMWKHYFTRGLVHGLDLVDKSAVDEPRLSTIAGDQSDRALLARLHKEIGPFDLVIDDGSHQSDHVLASFTTLFPLMRPGAMYVIEDLQASYWPGYNGNSVELNDPGTAVGFLKTLIDGLHHQDQLRASPHEPADLERGVTAIHLYHNIAFIEKGVNTEQTAPAWLPREAALDG
ncbi:class I SAM-dependent methyltransferase [Nocardia sp. NPDC046473]|uniref:class I SAM-dependent methyltransferase n=1 Tax=Nocardia sp. NPDC046473 TaxID=3155733 RepID=UPI0033C77F60